MPGSIAVARLVVGILLAALVCFPRNSRGQLPDALPPSHPSAVEERLRLLEANNARLLELLERDRNDADRRYRELEERYRDLQRRIEEPKGEAEVGGDAPIGRNSHLGRPGELGRRSAENDRKLKASLGDGFGLSSTDDEFELRFHVLDQTDFKNFVPNDRTYGKSGLYIPRVRVYLEGRLTRYWEYEVSLQRSLEGAWDLLDGNVNFRYSDGLQVKFGRMLVPYSYEWFDHLEQYFIAPERALFPLNFGLSRQAGLMLWGRQLDGRLDYAIGGFNGHLSGLADNNPNQEAVGYFNARPFLQSEAFPALRHLYVGASGSIGQVARPEATLPLRTSVQSAENDEAANDSTVIFLKFNDAAIYRGNRQFGAIHLAYYAGGLSIESEYNAGQFQMFRPGLQRLANIPTTGFHATVGYFVTGEQVERRTTVIPLRPFQPLQAGGWGPGAIEPFARFSQLSLGNSVFDEGLAEANLWSNRANLVDVGLNWYPNRWVKFYFDWQHANFGSPVLINEGRQTFGRASDMFWIRCQVYF
ncbi:MAG: porin [Isosphaeraceae bacterium]